MKHQEVRLLQYLLNNYGCVPLPAWAKEPVVMTLRARGFIETTVDFQNAYITDNGISALAEHREKVIAVVFDRVVAVITTLISIAALIVSVIALRQS